MPANVREIREIAAASVNYKCPHCDTVMSMGTDGQRVGEPFQCFCKRWVVIPHDVNLQMPRLNAVWQAPSHPVSLNSMVTFRLTQEGRKLFKTLARKEVEGTHAQPRQLDTDDNDAMTLPLWDFMNFFGASLHHGMTAILFEENSITIAK